MKLPEFNEKGERMVLDHDPVPGYGFAFWVCFLAGLAYLALILFMSMGTPVAGH